MSTFTVLIIGKALIGIVALTYLVVRASQWIACRPSARRRERMDDSEPTSVIDQRIAAAEAQFYAQPPRPWHETAVKGFYRPTVDQVHRDDPRR